MGVMRGSGNWQRRVLKSYSLLVVGYGVVAQPYGGGPPRVAHQAALQQLLRDVVHVVIKVLQQHRGASLDGPEEGR